MFLWYCGHEVWPEWIPPLNELPEPIYNGMPLTLKAILLEVASAVQIDLLVSFGAGLIAGGVVAANMVRTKQPHQRTLI
ncbi:hypothetical protein MRX96_049365 [Rhipicephalus microplus]